MEKTPLTCIRQCFLVKKLTVNLLEGESVYYHPEIVQEGKGDDHGPVVTQTPRWIKYKRPVRSTGSKSLVVRIAATEAISTAKRKIKKFELRIFNSTVSLNNL